MRIIEPFVKAHLALRLASRGAASITVSVDGAEPNPIVVRQILTMAGYTRTPLERSRAEWTGKYKAVSGAEILVNSRPGIDVSASLPNGQACVAECKGEPTAKGIKSGMDLTSFYTCVGQLILRRGGEKILAVPKGTRFTTMALRHKTALRSSNIKVVLIDEAGHLEEA